MLRTGEYHITGILREEVILKTLPMAHSFFQKYRSHLKILSARRVSRIKFHALEDTEILGQTVQKFCRHNDLSPGICVPLENYIDGNIIPKLGAGTAWSL